jgi:hypothetical protein
MFPRLQCQKKPHCSHHLLNLDESKIISHISVSVLDPLLLFACKTIGSKLSRWSRSSYNTLQTLIPTSSET